jgi:hypothetical protein
MGLRSTSSLRSNATSALDLKLLVRSLRSNAGLMTARCHGAPGLVPMLCAAAAAYTDRRDEYLAAAGFFLKKKNSLSKSMYRVCA